MHEFWNSFEAWMGLGIEPKNLTFLQISLRGVVVMIASLIMIRLGSKRALAEKTAFDAVLIVILASVLSRAINGSASFWPTLGAGFLIVLLHRAAASMAYRWHWLGIVIKGEPHVLLRDGQFDFKAMRRNHISQHDFEEDMRLDAKVDDKSKLKVARIERSGDISFIKKES